MLRAGYRYPIVQGDMLAMYRSGLASWTGLKCAPTRTDAKRALTLREDSGPDNGAGVAAWGYGVNVWADSDIDAKKIALDAMTVTLTIPGLVGSIKAIRNVVGPYSIDDEPAFTHGGKPLVHYYFSFDAVVKAAGV